VEEVAWHRPHLYDSPKSLYYQLVSREIALIRQAIS
jgi:hypothetical protein